MWKNESGKTKFRISVKSVNKERDLGVLICEDVKFSKQCLTAKNKANLMLGIINRGVSYKSSEVI